MPPRPKPSSGPHPPLLPPTGPLTLPTPPATRRTLPPPTTFHHPTIVPLPSLTPTRQLGACVFLCTLNPTGIPYAPATTSVVAKIADTEAMRILNAHEAAMYARLEILRGPTFPGCQTNHLFIPVPRLLGQVVDGEGLPVGVLLEFVEGRAAGRTDEGRCLEAVRKLHEVGIVHGDVKRRNFIVKGDGEVVVVDLEWGRIGVGWEDIEGEVKMFHKDFNG